MSFMDLQARVAALAQQTGYKSQFPAPNWGYLINQALGDFCFDTEFNEEEATFTTVAGQATYTLPLPYFKVIKEAAYGTTIRLRRTSETEERALDALWFTRPATTPSRFMTPEFNAVRLVDPPSVTGDVVTVRGVRAVPDLVNPTDTPAVPGTWLEGVCCRAAWLHCKSWAMSDKATMQTVANYLAQYESDVKACKGAASTQRYGTIRRRVQRSRDRLFVSGYNPYTS